MFFSVLNMPEMIKLHGSVNEIWQGLNEGYVHPIKDQITIIKKTDTYMPTLLQSLCIVGLNENNSLHKEKVYER